MAHRPRGEAGPGAGARGTLPRRGPPHVLLSVACAEDTLQTAVSAHNSACIDALLPEEKKLNLLVRYEAHLSRKLSRALKDLLSLQKERSRSNSPRRRPAQAHAHTHAPGADPTALAPAAELAGTPSTPNTSTPNTAAQRPAHAPGADPTELAPATDEQDNKTNPSVTLSPSHPVTSSPAVAPSPGTGLLGKVARLFGSRGQATTPEAPEYKTNPPAPDVELSPGAARDARNRPAAPGLREAAVAVSGSPAAWKAIPEAASCRSACPPEPSAASQPASRDEQTSSGVKSLPGAARDLASGPAPASARDPVSAARSGSGTPDCKTNGGPNTQHRTPNTPGEPEYKTNPGRSLTTHTPTHPHTHTPTHAQGVPAAGSSI
jgi:hypothetical protein